MKIENIQTQNTNTIQTTKNIEKDTAKATSTKETPAVSYEKSEKKQSVGHVYDKVTVEQLKRDSEKAYGYLKKIVEDMLKRQGMTFKDIDTAASIEVDEQARLEAQELIGPEGDLGVEKVSQRLVDFAIALSGGDKSKADTLKKAIEQGFKEAEKILGELPEISKETYKATMEKFDAYFYGEEDK